MKTATTKNRFLQIGGGAEIRCSRLPAVFVRLLGLDYPEGGFAISAYTI